MMIEILKSKIHRATFTDANLNYNGSITIYYDLQEQTRTDKYIACLEEISYGCGYIDKCQMIDQAQKHQNSEYGKYLQGMVNEI